jgi:hypothetical protein
MRKQLSAAQIFEYCPRAMNLIGFPSSPLFDMLSETLSREVLLKPYKNREGAEKTIIPSFPLDYITKRQEFFEGLSNEKIDRYIFQREFPKKQKGRRRVEDFLYFCEAVYDTIERARGVLKDFNQTLESRRIVNRLSSFDANLEAVLKTLEQIEEADNFAINTKTGLITPIAEIPDQTNKSPYQIENIGNGENLHDLYEVKVKMKKTVLSMVKQGKDHFKRGIMQFVDDEFSFMPGEENLRWDFEQLAVPVRLYSAYRNFLDKSREVESEQNFSLTYPDFSYHYEIKNLFPLNLLNIWSKNEPVAINFKTKRSERKFILAGLHSGGKSFFLENLVLALITGQIPLRMPAEQLVLPNYKKIFYYRNPNNGGSGDGKLIGEVRATENIISQAGKDDVIFLDEFLDSVSTGTATYLVPLMLDRLRKSAATVFVSTHRGIDYKKLEMNGWAIMSPEHQIINGRVVPAHKLKRGIPDERINRRFVAEKCEKILNPKEEDFDVEN